MAVKGEFGEKLNKGLLGLVLLFALIVIGMITFFALNYERFLGRQIVEVDKVNTVETVNQDSGLPSSKEVYDYTQAVFNRITNDGDDYVPEIHDEIALKETAAHFGIDYEKANELYITEAMGVFVPIEEQKSVISEELFNQIRTGMTYEEVKALTNMEGILVSEGEGISIYDYESGGTSSVSLVFADGELISKSQSGLLEPGKITLEQYHLVTEGMTLLEVEAVLGAGEYGGNMITPNGEFDTYWYEGVSGGSAQLTFYNGSLGKKEKYALK